MRPEWTTNGTDNGTNVLYAYLLATETQLIPRYEVHGDGLGGIAMRRRSGRWCNTHDVQSLEQHLRGMVRALHTICTMRTVEAIHTVAHTVLHDAQEDLKKLHDDIVYSPGNH